MSNRVDAILSVRDKNFTSGMAAAQASLNGLDSSMNKTMATGQRMEAIGNVMTKAVTLPLMAVGAAALKVGADFESSMNTVQARTGMTADEVDGLGDSFRDMAMSGEFGNFTARQVAEAYSQVAVRGQTAADATKLMGASMTLATATGNDLAATSYMIGNYLLKVGKDASYADRYIDLFALGIANTGISLADMQNYMFRLTPAFEQFGSSTETNIALMTRMYQAGIRGANLYSGLGTIMTDFAVRGEATTSMMQHFGVAMYDSNNQARSNEDRMFDLAQAMAEYGDEMVVNTMVTENFNQTQQAAWFEFMNLAGEIRGEVIPAFYAASDAYDGLGIAAQTASIEQGGLSAQIQRLRMMLEEKAKQIATHLIPAAMRLVESLGRLMQRFASLNPETQRFLVRLGAIAAAAGPVLKITGRMVQSYAKLKAGYKSLRAVMIAHKAVQKAGVTKTMLQSVATGKLTAAQMANFKSITVNASGVVTLNKAKSAQLATEIKLAAAKQKGIAATMGKVGALKAQLAATKGLAAKTKVLNVAMKATPIGLKLGLVGGLIGALGALGGALLRASDDTNGLRERQEALRNSTEELQSSMANSQASFANNRQEIQQSSGHISSLTDRVIELANSSNRTADETAELKGRIDQLNSAVPGLNLEFDSLNGTLSKTDDEIRNVTRSMIDQAKKALYIERIAELYMEIEEATRIAAKASDLYTDAVENATTATDNLTYAGFEVVECFEDLRTAAEEAIQELESAEAQMEDLERSLFDLQATTAEATASMGEDFKKCGEIISATKEQINAALEQLGDAYTRTSERAANAFQKMETTTEHTMESMNATLMYNAKATVQWGENIATIMDRATAKGVDEGVLAHMKRMANESPAIAAVMASATEEEFRQMAKNLEVVSEASVDKIANAYGVDTSVAEAAKNLAREGVEQSIADTLEAADFEALGIGVSQGLADGITSGSPFAATSGQEMADQVCQEVKNALQSSSPSQVMVIIGEGIPEGLSMGITSNSDAAVSAMEQLADMMINALESGLSAMDSIGTTSFSGIANSARTGMNQVVSTTRNSSNQASSALSSGLRGMGTATQSNMSTMQSTTTTGMNQVRTAITQGVSQSNQAMTQGLTQMNNSTRTKMTNIQNTTRTGMTQMNSVVRSNMQTMQSTTQSAMSSFSSSVSSSMNSARSSVSSAAAGMVGALGGLSGSFFSAGVAAGHGLASGIAASRGAAVAAAQATANATAAALRAGMQIASPSRVTMLIGRFVGEGFALGMEDKMRRIKNVAAEMANAALPHVGNDLSFAGMGSMDLGGEYIYDATHTIIVPVEIDGREVARATAEYNQEEADILEDRANRRRR